MDFPWTSTAPTVLIVDEDAHVRRLMEVALREEGYAVDVATDGLDALERDHEFLLHGSVFTEDVIETWIDYKRKAEVAAIRVRPHPYEFALYFDS